MKTLIRILFLVTFFSSVGYAHLGDFSQIPTTAVYADLSILKKAGVPVLYSDRGLNMGYAVATGEMQAKISEVAHRYGRCGNFEALPEIPRDLRSVAAEFGQLQKIEAQHAVYSSLARSQFFVEQKPEIVGALQQLQSAKIRETVEWLSAYPTRFNRGTEPNKHVNDFAAKLQALIQGVSYPVSVELISHRNTPQKSVKLTITGAVRPNELVVLGGHLDSIVGWSGGGRAPGADDNASGSASLLEALRILLTQPQPQRTVEFMWYAGEESGLLGSAEIAETYKNQQKNVIAVLQLDMTLFPGDGEFRISSMSDFTSPWLRDYLKAINLAYLNVEIMDDRCGYGCSDHASWHRRGFPALFPTEARFNSSFRHIHTVRDVINDSFSFEHALIFSKIALVFGMDLANSEMKQPLN
jgi:leucyl aminopeptidase